MKPILIIAVNAFRETVRDKILYNLVLFAVGLILFSLLLGEWSVFARQTVISTPGTGMARWREHLFVTMSRNARGAADYYQIPPNRVIELGTQVEI